MNFEIKQVTRRDHHLMNDLLDLFGEAFEEPEIYDGKRPDDVYMQKLLNNDAFIALVALKQNNVIGGLVAYELRKFEQKRSEIYIYDLAVAERYRRCGIATALIENLKHIAKKRDVWVIFVQADYTDEPAIRLYEKLGKREKVLHFDVPVIKVN